jgi:hypothetical protein
MPLKKAKTRVQLLKEIRKAVKAAGADGVSDAQEMVKIIIESKHLYITWKNQIRR